MGVYPIFIPPKALAVATSISVAILILALPSNATALLVTLPVKVIFLAVASLVAVAAFPSSSPLKVPALKSLFETSAESLLFHVILGNPLASPN